MLQTVSKSQFKIQVLELLRVVEKKGKPLVVTHLGKPVIKVSPYKEKTLLESLRKSVLSYQGPTKPVAEKDWESV